MANEFKVKKALNISSGGTGAASGDITVNSNELEFHNGTAAKKVATESNTVTFTNKSISGATNTITAVPGANVTNTPSGNLAATDVQGALNELQSDIDTRATATSVSDHLADATDAHDASAISSVAAGNLAATNVQTALDELQSDIDTRATATSVSDHLADTTDAHDASAISSVAAGNLAATNVQSALDELQTDIDTRETVTNVSGRFNTSTGHDHDGTDAKKVLGTNIDSAAETNGKVLTANGSGGSTWEATASSNLAVASKTANYTVTSNDAFLKGDSSGGAFTFTLPAAASNTGKQFIFVKTDSSFTAITIDGNGSETIDGSTTTTLNTQYERLEIVSDGTNWISRSRSIPGLWTSYTPTGNWTTGANNATYTGKWRRVGDSVELQINVAVGSSGVSGSLFGITLPSGLTIDTAKLTSTTLANHGWGTAIDGGNATYPVWIRYESTTTMDTLVTGTASTYANNPANINATTPFTFASGDSVSLFAKFPITGWSAG